MDQLDRDIDNAVDAYKAKHGLTFDWYRISMLPDYEENRQEILDKLTASLESGNTLTDKDFGLKEMPKDVLW